MFRLCANLFSMKQDNEVSAALSASIAELLQERGLTQRELANATQIPLATLNRRLACVAPFTVIELAAIARVLHTSITDLALKAERSMAGAAA